MRRQQPCPGQDQRADPRHDGTAEVARRPVPGGAERGGTTTIGRAADHHQAEAGMPRRQAARQRQPVFLAPVLRLDLGARRHGHEIADGGEIPQCGGGGGALVRREAQIPERRIVGRGGPQQPQAAQQECGLALPQPGRGIEEMLSPGPEFGHADDRRDAAADEEGEVAQHAHPRAAFGEIDQHVRRQRADLAPHPRDRRGAAIGRIEMHVGVDQSGAAEHDVQIGLARAARHVGQHDAPRAGKGARDVAEAGQRDHRVAKAAEAEDQHRAGGRRRLATAHATPPKAAWT